MKKSNIVKTSEMKRIFCDSELIPTALLRGYYLLVLDLMETPNIADNSILYKELCSCISKLERKKQDCISLRYGLRDGNVLTFETISKRYNITRERIRQIVELASDELRSKKTAYHIPHRIELLKLKKDAIKKEIDKYEAIINNTQSISISLNDFNFSTRAMNALCSQGITTYNELMKLKPEEVFNLRSIGLKTANEIWLKIHGKEITRYLYPLLGGFEFGTRATNLLLQNGICSYDQLINISAETLGSLKGMGTKTANEIWQKVHGKPFPHIIAS